MTMCLSVVVAKLRMILPASLLNSEVKKIPNGHPKVLYRTVANSDYTSKVQTIPKGHSRGPSYMGLYWTIDKSDTVHCMIYTVHCTMYTVQYTLYTVHCTPYTAHRTLHTLYYKLNTAHCTMHFILHTMS